MWVWADRAVLGSSENFCKYATLLSYFWFFFVEKYKIWVSAHCSVLTKGQTKSKWFFQVKKSMNEFYFTTIKPQVDLFSFVFWKKLKVSKLHFEINWPLVYSRMRKHFLNCQVGVPKSDTSSVCLPHLPIHLHWWHFFFCHIKGKGVSKKKFCHFLKVVLTLAQ